MKKITATIKTELLFNRIKSLAKKYHIPIMIIMSGDDAISMMTHSYDISNKGLENILKALSVIEKEVKQTIKNSQNDIKDQSN